MSAPSHRPGKMQKGLRQAVRTYKDLLILTFSAETGARPGSVDFATAVVAQRTISSCDTARVSLACLQQYGGDGFVES